MAALQELPTLNLFGSDLAKSLIDVYMPIFEHIRTYGTIVDPLFVAKDVQDVLEIPDMNYKREGSGFDWIIHKVRIPVKTAKGTRETIALTEMGIYRAIYKSTTGKAIKFQLFITTVMKKLRMTGEVKADEAVEDYKRELAALQHKFDVQGNQMDEEHKAYMKLKDYNDYQANQLYDTQIDNYHKKETIKNMKEPSLWEMKDRMQRVQHMYMKPLVVHIVEPPKESGYEYEVEDYEPYDIDRVPHDEDMVFGISFTEMKKGVPIHKIYVHKTVKLEDVHAALIKMDSAVEKAAGGRYANAYATTLDQLDDVVDMINKTKEPDISFLSQN